MTIPLGIHFGLPEEKYHADSALGSGSIRQLARCPIHYWAGSDMNPLREARAETSALLYGRALHSLVLEGVDKFRLSYMREPDKADYPEALDTTDDIKTALRSLGQKVSGAKPELIARLKEADPGAVFWDDIKSAVDADAAKIGATVLKRDAYQNVVAAAGYIAGEEHIKSHFRNGVSEASVFWERDGVRCKARLDYTKMGQKTSSRAVGVVTDLKSYANMNSKPPERAVIDAIANHRLDIQAAHYFDGLSRVSDFFRSSMVYGQQGIAQEWLDALADLGPADWVWYWCFYEKGAPISLLRSTRPDAPMIELAKIEVERALRSYAEHMERFGTEWKFVDPIADTEISVEDLPRWLGAQVGA